MPKRPVPTDNDTTTPTEQEWGSADPALDHHRTRAQQSPAYQRTVDEITTRQATLAELRRAFQLSQQSLAELLDMSQSELSRIERRSDLLLSTLKRFVEATGGRLQLLATYPGSDPIEIRLSTLSQPANTAKSPT